MIEYLMEISFRKRTIILKTLDILSDQDKNYKNSICGCNYIKTAIAMINIFRSFEQDISEHKNGTM